MLYLSPGGAFIEDNDNPFYQKKSFIQDVESCLQKEFMKFEKDNNLKSSKGQSGRFQQNSAVQGFGASPSAGQLDSLGELSPQQNKREMSKSRLNQTMYRELLSWIGLFTSQKDLLKFISKRDQNQPP